MEKTYFVYILASKRYGTLYIGLTGNLEARLAQHKAGIGSVFTKKYDVSTLVYYEQFAEILEAKAREKALKVWKRDWKIALIEKSNPMWQEVLLY